MCKRIKVDRKIEESIYEELKKRLKTVGMVYITTKGMYSFLDRNDLLPDRYENRRQGMGFVTRLMEHIYYNHPSWMIVQKHNGNFKILRVLRRRDGNGH